MTNGLFRFSSGWLGASVIQRVLLEAADLPYIPLHLRTPGLAIAGGIWMMLLGIVILQKEAKKNSL